MLAKLKNKKLLVFLDQVIVSGSNFILGILLARSLSIEMYGQYALLWMFALFFLSMQQSAIISPMYSLEPKRSDNNSYHLSNVIAMQVFFALLSMVLIAVLLTVLPLFQKKWDIGIHIFSFSLAVLIFLLQDFFRRLFFLKEKYFIVFMMDIIAYMGLLILLLQLSDFILLNLSEFFFYFSLTFFLSFTLALLAFFKMDYTDCKMNRIMETVKEYWSFSKWLSLSNIFQWLSGNLFIVVGGYLLGNWSVGTIRVFQNTMGVFHVIFLALENFVPISAAKTYKATGYKSLLKYIYRYGVFGIISFMLIGIVFFVFTPESLISLIYGNKYSQYGNLLYWYLVIYILIYFCTLARFILRTIELTKEIYKAYIYTMFFSLIFSYPLVSFYKINGVIFGTLLIQIIMTVIYFINIKIK